MTSALIDASFRKCVENRGWGWAGWVVRLVDLVCVCSAGYESPQARRIYRLSESIHAHHRELTDNRLEFND